MSTLAPSTRRSAGRSFDRLDVDVVPVDQLLATEWDDLATKVGADVYSRPAWCRAWADAYLSGELHCITARSAGELVGVVPVVRRRWSLPSATNSETPRLVPVLADPAVLWHMVSDLPRRWQHLSVHFTPAEDPAVSTLREGAEGPVRTLFRECRSSPFVDTDGSFEDYEKSRLSSHTRNNLRRFERRLRQVGEVSFEIHDGSHGLDRLLEEGFGLESSGWKGENGTDVLSRPSARRLYWQAASWAASEGKLGLHFLRVDGRPVAFTFTIRDSHTVSILKFAIEDEMKRCAPGRLHIISLLPHCFGDPDIRRLDFLGEAESFKLDFATGSERQGHLDVFRPEMPGRLWFRSTQGAWAVRARIRARVPLEVRKRLDWSTPAGAARSLGTLARSQRSESRARTEADGKRQ